MVNRLVKQGLQIKMTLTQSGDIREKIADQTLLHLWKVKHVCYRTDNELPCKTDDNSLRYIQVSPPV